MVATRLVLVGDDPVDTMSGERLLLGSREPVETDTDSELVPLSDAGTVIDALASGTSRRIMSALYEQPQTASDLAEAVDTSMQNVDYHLDKLHDAELVEVADTWYSAKGAEMDVFAPTNDPLVMFAGRPGAEPEVDEFVSDPGRPAQPSD